MEVWKNIPESKYYISNYGNVKSYKGKLLKPQNKNGYSTILLYRNGKPFRFRIHRLVAELFIPNPLNFPQVHHKNDIRNDNRVENLEWVTAKTNIGFINRNKILLSQIKKIVTNNSSIKTLEELFDYLKN